MNIDDLDEWTARGPRDGPLRLLNTQLKRRRQDHAGHRREQR